MDTKKFHKEFHGALNSLHITLMLILCSIIINVLLYVCTVCVIMLNKYIYIYKKKKKKKKNLRNLLYTGKVIKYINPNATG